MDFSEYENADIVFDLNQNLPVNMFEKYDYVINGGTLEHIFDVAKAMRNISDMVKPEGIIIHVVPFAGLADHGFYSFSPTFFQDYYEANDFVIIDLNIEFLLYDNNVIFSQDCRIFDNDYSKLNDYVKEIMQINEVECALLMCIAQKKDSKDALYPIQGMYRRIYSKSNGKHDICYHDIFELLKGNSDKKIAIYGAGHISNLLIDELYKSDMESVVDYIIESDISKSGTYHRGYKVFYPTKLKLGELDMILICTTKYEDDIYDLLLEKGVEKRVVYRITDYMK